MSEDTEQKIETSSRKHVEYSGSKGLGVSGNMWVLGA